VGEGALTPNSSAEFARLAERVEMAGMIDWFEAAGPELSASLGLSVVPAADGVAFRAHGFPGFLFNRAIGFGFESPLDEAALDGVIASYHEAGIPQFSIQPCPFAAPGEMRAWLDRRGHRAWFHWVKWLRSTDSPPEARTELRIERIGRDRAATFGAIAELVFALPGAGAWADRLVGRPRWSHYIAFDGDSPVAIAAMFVDGEVANFLSAATLDGHRGRGAQSALIARRLRDASAVGARWAIVETAEDVPERPAPSYRNQRRAGFRVLYLRPSHVWPPPEKRSP
jgi:hypothetical protein